MILEDSIFKSFIIDSYGYILFLGVAILLLFQKDKRAHYVFLSVLILFAGLRGGLGPDFINYNKWYNTTINDNNLEIGYVVLMNFFKFLNLSIFHLQFFFSIILVLLVDLVLKKYTNNVKYAWLVFLIFPYFYLYSFILMRQYFAIVIIFFGFQFLLNKKYSYFIIAVLIGSLIHYSALLAGLLILLLFNLSKIITLRYLILILVISIPFAFIDWFYMFKDFFLGTKYQGYFLEKNIESVNYLRLLVLNFEVFFFIFYYKELINYNKKNKYFIVLVLFAFILENLFTKIPLLNRFSFYFKFFELILFADIISIKKYRIYLPIILIYGLRLFFYVLWYDYYTPGIHTKLAPYKNILFNR